MDYLILSRSLIENVIKFKVLPPSFHSNHSPVTATFKSSFVKFAGFFFHSLLSQKDIREKLGKLRFYLNSSNNTNAIQILSKNSVKSHQSVVIKL